jgi:hypothetical protein
VQALDPGVTGLLEEAEMGVHVPDVIVVVAIEEGAAGL